MKWTQLLRWLFPMGALWIGLAVAGAAEPKDITMQRDQLLKTFQAGNYKDAYEGFRKLALDPRRRSPPGGRRPEHGRAVPPAPQPGRRDRRLPRGGDRGPQGELAAAVGRGAELSCSIQHHGFIVAGKFERGNHRGGGQVVNAVERDRVRALQLMVQAMPLARQDDDQRAKWATFLLSLAEHAAEQPRLQRGLAAAVPDRPERAARLRAGLGLLSAEPRGPGRRRGQAGLPLRAQELRGGQDRRRALAVVPGAGHGVQPGPRQRGPHAVRRLPADQFGVQTMAEYGWFFGRAAERRHQEGRERHLRPAHAERERDHRPAGHGHQAVQAARRVQLHQDLPAGRRGGQGRARARRPWSNWRRSSRTAGSIPRRPTTGDGVEGSRGQTRPGQGAGSARAGSSGSTRSWATGAASSRS